MVTELTCNRCTKDIRHHQQHIICKACNLYYHTRCISSNINRSYDWFCQDCNGDLFPFNHILDDNEFKFSIHYFDNSFDYNKMLNLKLNPFLFEDLYSMLNNHNSDLDNSSNNSCSYIFDQNCEIKYSDEGFSILHLNSRSFNKNRDAIEIFLDRNDHVFSIIAMSETWFYEDESNLIHINNYTLYHTPRKSRKSGGVALYVHDSLSIKKRDDLILIQNQTNEIDHSESIFIELINPKGNNITVGNIYRAHHTDTSLFISDLTHCLTKIAGENKKSYISGDFNLDLLKAGNENYVDEFINAFYTNNMFPLIDRPTRITSSTATLLDNIFTNVLSHKIQSGIFVTELTDHYPIFQSTGTFEIKRKKPQHFTVRSFNQDNIILFKNRMQLVDWNYSVMCENDPDLAYNSFHKKFMDIYNDCFPLRTKSNRVN